MKSPRVNTIAGSENKIRIGLIKKLTTASTSPANITSVIPPLYPIDPLKNLEAIHKPSAQTNHLVRKLKTFLFIKYILAYSRHQPTELLRRL